MDPLARLWMPTDERGQLRLWPGRPNPGRVEWKEDHFHTRLPHRFGDIGWLPGRGAWANGGWYPQELPGGRLPIRQWEVELSLPAGVVGVLNGVLGEDRLVWSGTSDRLSIAAIARPIVTEVAVGEGRLRFLEARDVLPERHLHRWLPKLLEEWALSGPPDLVVVEDLDFVNLATSGPGVLYLSDRAARLTPPLGFVHGRAVRRRAHEASVPLASGWWRAWTASALADSLPAPSVQKLLGWFSWNPVVDALLNDGTLPYYQDIFDLPDSPPSGVQSIETPRISPRAAALQLDALLGNGAATGLARRTVNAAVVACDHVPGTAPEGGPACGDLDPAALLAGDIPVDLLEGWTRTYPRDQNYQVVVEKGELLLRRDAPVDAPPEVIEIKDQGRRELWLTGPGPSSRSIGEPRPVRVDPGGHAVQRERVDDHWPARWRPIFTGGIYNISPTQQSFDALVEVYTRREGDTRNLYYLAATHDQQDVVAIVPGYLRYFGPLLDQRIRQHRLNFSGSIAYLDPAFRPTPDGKFALGLGTRYAWDTRQESRALAGHRYALGVGAGWIPGSTELWASGSALGIQYFLLHPRHVLALRGSTAAASGDVDHRLISLGGGDALRCLPEDAALGNWAASLNLEYRLTLLRHASIPLLLGWLSELRLSPGVEAGMLYRDGEWVRAVGGTVGVFPIVEGLGTRAGLVGLTFAWPLWTDGVDPPPMQIYLEFELPY